MIDNRDGAMFFSDPPSVTFLDESAMSIGKSYSTKYSDEAGLGPDMYESDDTNIYVKIHIQLVLTIQL